MMQWMKNNTFQSQKYLSMDTDNHVAPPFPLFPGFACKTCDVS